LPNPDVPRIASSRIASPSTSPRLRPSNPPEWEDESPYPEVRAAVSNTDDMEMPVDTFRAWTIGLLWAVLIPGLNQFLHFRYPSISIGSVRASFFSPFFFLSFFGRFPLLCGKTVLT
jgi:hypothetical protein